MRVRYTLLVLLTATLLPATADSQQVVIEFAPPVSVVMADKINAVKMADVNSDGDLDIIALQGEPALTSGVFVALGDGSGNFDAPVFNAVSINWPWDVDFGDINEDGVIDAVVTDFLSGQFAYMEGNGDGTFSEQPRLVPGWGGGNPQVQLADIDQDGHLDVIAVELFGSRLQVAWGTGIDDPLAAFDGLESVLLTGYPLSFDIADLDGDGDLDLCCGFNAGSGGGVATSLYQGNRTFSAEERSIGGLTDSHWSTIAIDLDGGLPEIVTVEEGLGNLGIFTVAAGIPQAGIPIFTGSNQRYVAGGDLDLDGITDLVIRNYSSGDLVILQGTGALEFLDAWTLDGSVSFSGLELVDVNGDGSLDIIAGNYDQSTVSYYLNLTF
ncbi:MAG: VCBS repeat-containing protein, partial [Planctomycetota bacterium]|nr:VCBS repeat-containing protein [Planctomycetota bacterium]